MQLQRQEPRETGTAVGRPAAVLVTGATGFLGSHLVDHLETEGQRTRCLVRRPDALLSGSPRVARWPGDVTDANSVCRAADGVDTIFHLAGTAAVNGDPQMMSAAILANVVGTLNVLEAARRGGVARVVLVSSSHVYGCPAGPLVGEGAPLAPQSPYASTKVAAEALARTYDATHGVAVTIVRPANVYGPRQTADAVVPTIVRQALQHPMVSVRSLRPRRDFVYVTDVVDALVRAARLPRAAGRTFNIGSGSDVSIGELVARTLRLCGRPDDVPDLEGDATDRVTLDSGLARSVLGWTPQVALDEGLARTIAWWRERLTAEGGGGPHD
ncbi:NAD-dependent epimerase/dehydratase family protein [Azospirillum halopraeferens]|uniref:NAD-dependent epimerase/dehydratase family protein n=1 Tax=Azospirillum halopraeferens TaxID=34010 RepID=UPI00040C533B|nr:NAD-dependent epimerase/dehydratase family protein [Azospirillum halopraeferens]